MSQTSIRTKPELWEKVKKIVIKSPKGGVSGKWSARKAQLAVALYKKKGGGYKGKKSPRNSLVKWTKEDWGYINENKKSKRKSKSKKSGRYLPKKVREQLTPREKQIENRLKGTKRGKWVPYSKSVAKKVSKVVSRKR